MDLTDALTDKLFNDCLNGKPINVNKIDFTAKDVSYLFGAAKEYQREGEFFETYEKDIRAANKSYKRCERLEKLAAAIQKKLAAIEHTDLQTILDIEATDLNGEATTIRELLKKISKKEKAKLLNVISS